MVNGVPMDNVYSNFTIQTLKSCGKIANITVKRPRKIQIPATTRPSRASSQSNLLDPDTTRRTRASSQSNLLDSDPTRRTRRFSDGSDQFLVSIPEVVDSAPNSEEDRNRDSSSEMEDISDIEEDITPRRTSKQHTRERRTRRARAEPSQRAKSRDTSPVRSTMPPLRSYTSRKDPVDSESDRSASPPPVRKVVPELNPNKYKPLSGMTTLPNPKFSPMNPTWNTSRASSSSLRPRKPVSESDSDRSSSPPPRIDSPRLDRYKSLSDLPPADVSSSPILIRQDPLRKDSTDSEDNTTNRPSILPKKSTSVAAKPEPSRSVQPPTRPPPDDSSESDELSHLRRSGSSEREDSKRRAPRAANGNSTVRSGISVKNNPMLQSKPEEEPLYFLPPDSYPSSNPGYSSDVQTVRFVKENSMGLRLVGGNDVGIFVGGVQPNSPAYAQGMKEGDQILQVNKVDFSHFTREEAANFLLNIPAGEPVEISTQKKMDIFKKIIGSTNFKRPIVILGPLNDIAMEKLAREMPDEYEVAEMVPRGGGDSSSTVIKLDTVRKIAEKDKHPLLDITPTAVERLNYIQYHPMVLFLDPHSRKDVKAMRQRYNPSSNKSSRRLYSQAMKMKKHCSHLFSARIGLQPGSNSWYDTLKEKIRHQQLKPVWVPEVTLETGDQDLDALDQTQTDYLSAASDLEDTDGEPFTDGEAYTDNEDLEEGRNAAKYQQSSREAGAALARSSEPAYSAADEAEDSDDEYPEREIPPLMQVPEPRSARLESHSPPRSAAEEEDPSHRSFSDSDFDALDEVAHNTPSDEPPDFVAPNPVTGYSVDEPYLMMKMMNLKRRSRSSQRAIRMLASLLSNRD
uniref:Tight junction protein 3 n=1 Tax=Nothobranchius furzeri TaxID=105023 RepID=A0A1A8UG19_NOTFU